MVFASLYLWIGFEGVVDDRANESWELGVLFAFTSLWINGRLGVWVFATSIGQLSLITTAEIKCKGGDGLCFEIFSVVV